MYVYEVFYIPTKQIDTIAGKTITDICSEILNYNNGKILDTNTNTNDYSVNFRDYKGNNILTIYESSLLFAILGNEITNPITDSIKEDSHKFWLMDSDEVHIIEFNNPLHPGEAVWEVNENDEEYMYNLSCSSSHDSHYSHNSHNIHNIHDINDSQESEVETNQNIKYHF